MCSRCFNIIIIIRIKSKRERRMRDTASKDELIVFLPFALILTSCPRWLLSGSSPASFQYPPGDIRGSRPWRERVWGTPPPTAPLSGAWATEAWRPTDLGAPAWTRLCCLSGNQQAGKSGQACSHIYISLLFVGVFSNMHTYTHIHMSGVAWLNPNNLNGCLKIILHRKKEM